MNLERVLRLIWMPLYRVITGFQFVLYSMILAHDAYVIQPNTPHLINTTWYYSSDTGCA